MRRENKPNSCRHFNGVQNKVCEAGISYEEVTRVKEEGNFGCWLKLPCTNATEANYPCPHLSRLTDAEVAEEERLTDLAVEKFLKQMPVARTAITQHIGDRKKQYVADSLPCPVCGKGTLRYRYMGNYNKHIHAKCTTEGCVSWQE